MHACTCEFAGLESLLASMESESEVYPQSDLDAAVVRKAKEIAFHPFPLARYWHSGDFRFYYAFGNTAAEDFLQSCSVGKQPMILSLGCGDVRSCFYTLWKHCDSSISKAPKKFDKVRFVLNDCSSPVQARNIIFLHLCLQLPQDIDDRKKWLCGMWAIWYCHELHPQHQRMLDDSLRVLLNYSNSLSRWENTTNPLGQMVQFTSPSALTEISNAWRTWLERKVNVASVQQMHLSRCAELKNRGVFDNLEVYAFSYSSSSTYISGDRNTSTMDTRKAEVKAYTECGNCYAENVFELELATVPTSVNLTLYERPDGVYSLHYGSMPFSGYYHTVKFAPDTMKSAGMKKASCDTMLVQSKSFISHPFLANSVQQFSMWIQSASKILAQGNIVTFTFSNDDALYFCQELRYKQGFKDSRFDAIYSSNLLDHLGPPNVILGAIHLLKESGLLFTTTLLYKNFTSTLDEYISSCFGFDCKLLPVMLGIRCINHEGAGYASVVMIEPTPVDMGNLLQVQQHSRTLIWENVSANSFKLPHLPPLVSGNITDGLFDSLRVATLSFLTNFAGQSTLNDNCIETAILTLQAFSSSLNAESSTSYQFWETLSSALSLKMKPFLNGLQTQFLLHKLHMHLTVNEGNCPICKHSPVEDYVGLFCAKVQLPIQYMTPFFMALVHRYSSSDSRYLCNEALSGKDVHIFDSIDGRVEGSILKLNFFVPLHFVERDYNITLALSYRTQERNIIVTCLTTTNLRDVQIDFMHYDFSQTVPLSKTGSNLSNFGELTSHIGDGERIWSEIKLSGSTLEALKLQKLTVDRVSSNKIKLSCGTIGFDLDLNFPVNYDRISVKLSKSQGTLKLVCPRQAHDFAEERPIFIAAPDHELSLPPQHIKDEIMVNHSGMQRNKEERQISDSCNRDHAHMTPLMNVKESFMIIFQHINEMYFRLTTPTLINRGFIVVHRRLFDFKFRAPTIDLAFCFLNPSNVATLARGWHSVTGSKTIRHIVVDDAEYKVLCDTLVYFANRTNGNCQSALKPNKYQALCRQGINQYFTRAVIYFLYCDPDHQGLDMLSQMKGMLTTFPKVFQTADVKPTGNPAIDEKCAYCGKYCRDAKKCTWCTWCKKVHYCSKDCQAKHWPAHSSNCKKIPEDRDAAGTNLATSSNGQSTKCTFCNKASNSLKKCLQCGEAQYCDRECQTKHWPEHRSSCKRSAEAKNESLDNSCAANLSFAREINPIKGEAITCTFCNKSSHALKKCLQCGKAQYCDRECQAKHWPAHKIECNTSTTQQHHLSESSSPRQSETSSSVCCACCGSSSVKLRACSRCGKVKYCKKECQIKHWKDHKGTCC